MVSGNNKKKNLTLTWAEWILSDIFLKILMLAIAYGLILGMFLAFLKQRQPYDPIVPIRNIDENTQKEFGNFSVKVDSGIFIKNFPKFDLAKNDFLIDAVVWFEFDVDQVTLENLEKFSFDRGDILKRMDPEIKIDDERMIVKYDIRLNFRGDLNYKAFPLNSHRISIVLTNNCLSPREVYYVVSSKAFRIQDGLFISDWNIIDTSAEAGYVEIELDPNQEHKTVEGADAQLSGRNFAYPKARFTFTVSSKGFQKLLVIFIPLFLTMLLSLFSFLGKLNNTIQRFTLASSPIPTLLGYRFVLENMLPQVTYLTLADKIFLLLLLLVILNFAIQIIFVRWADTVNSQPAGHNDVSVHNPEWRWLYVVNFTAFSVVVSFLLMGVGLILWQTA